MEQLHEYFPEILEWEFNDRIYISKYPMLNNKNIKWRIRLLINLGIHIIEYKEGYFQGVINNDEIVLKRNITGKLEKIIIPNNEIIYAVVNQSLKDRKYNQAIDQKNNNIKSELENSQYNEYLIVVRNTIEELKKEYNIQ